MLTVIVTKNSELGLNNEPFSIHQHTLITTLIHQLHLPEFIIFLINYSRKAG